MQQLISWSELWTWMVGIAFIWYTVVALRYYRRDIAAALKGKHQQRLATDGNDHFEKARAVKEPMRQATDPHTTVHELLEELKVVFAAFGKNPPSKRDALDAIAMRLKPCAWLEPSLRQAINQYIINEFSLHAGEAVTHGDIESLW